uniref:Ribonucleases P/MRP protein subunit POP1 n=1 Tax=Parastrongyloides trichosuri TaxID=131310 RepID=A0A0N5A245_PARTI
MSLNNGKGNEMDTDSSKYLVPRVIESTSFLKERVNLLADIYDAIGSKVPSDVKPTVPRTLLQRLPRHMRRRAMSHNIKRLPAIMRKFGAINLSKSKHRKKAPSRYWRRRPKNLYKNYIQRQRSVKWLETHIWHAKRFHMKSLWGFKIADRSFQKAHRAIYRSSKTHSTVADISFIRCIQIEGPSQEYIIEKMNGCCGIGKLTSFSFKPALKGLYEKTIMFYSLNQYPVKFIGPIRYLWIEDESNKKLLILWIHPSIFDEVMDNIKSIFSLVHPTDLEMEKEPKTLDDYKSFKNNGTIKKYIGNNVTVNDISDEMNRFRLCGPKSLNILFRSFKITSISRNAQKIVSTSFTPGNCQPNCIISLTVSCPNNVKRKGLLSGTENEDLFNIQINENDMFQIHNIGLDKEKYIEMYGENNIKIYLVNRKIQKFGISSVYDGFDIIIPKIFAREFWQNIQLSSGHVSGMESIKHLVFESCQFRFPIDVPDSVISQREESNETTELLTKYEKKPWNRRKQYWRKFKIMFPFSFEWNRLVNEWKVESHIEKLNEDVFVIRERETLDIINSFLKNKIISLPEKLITDNCNGLVPVSITPCNRGIPKRYALLCSIDDEEIFKKGMIKMNEEKNEIIFKNDDIGKNKARTLEEFEKNYEWKTVSLLEMFPSERIIKANKEISCKKIKKHKIKCRLERREKRLAIEKLEQEEKASCTYIKSSSPYQIIGRVVSGSYSFSKSQGHALGYIPLVALYKQSIRTNILFRNTNSFNYFQATLSIIMDECLEP